MAMSASTLVDCPQLHVTSTSGVNGRDPVAGPYEIFDEFLKSASLRCGTTYPNAAMAVHRDDSSDEDFDTRRSGSSSMSNVGAVLQNNIQSWCEATGLPTTIIVHCQDHSFQLHKFPLISRSGYMKRMLMDAKEVKIPDECPGDLEIFEIIVNFCYGSPFQMDPSNVADLRCAAEYLQMTEEYGKGNLCGRCDAYLNQVALQSWQDTMVVLLRCQNLCPFAEDLGIMGRCVECLAFLACVEMVEPLDKPSRAGTSIESQFWSDISVSTRDSSASPPEWWMDDLLRLPCCLFERVIAAIRTEGMQEKYVSQAIVKFVDRWVFASSYPDEADAAAVTDPPAESAHDRLVQTVVRLLPEERDAVPISFLFSLLRCALACNSSAESKSHLEFRIASQLELATISDFLYPFKITEGEGCISSAEVNCMRRIVNSFLTQQRSLSDPSETTRLTMSTYDVPENFYCAYAVSAVAKVWDEYLAEVARDLSLSPSKFTELAEVVPAYARATHDYLYRAIHVYLKGHPHFSQEERQTVCAILNCQKLSPDMCAHAVQNDLMPLRMIVQAMFMQQLQTRNVLNGHLRHSGQSARLESMLTQRQQQALPPAAAPPPHDQRRSLGFHLRAESFRSSQESFRPGHNSFGADSFSYEDDDEEVVVVEDRSAAAAAVAGGKREAAAFRQAALLKADYTATETRLQSLEEELAFMKRKINASTNNNAVGKSSSERFSAAAGDQSGRRKRKEALTSVRETVAAASSEDEERGGGGGGDHDDLDEQAGPEEVPRPTGNFSAKNGNVVGFLAKVLRLITLRPASAKRHHQHHHHKAGGGGGVDTTAAAACSDYMICGAKEIWQSADHLGRLDRKKKEQPSECGARDAGLVAKNGGGGSKAKVRHSRRHSIS